MNGHCPERKEAQDLNPVTLELLEARLQFLEVAQVASARAQAGLATWHPVRPSVPQPRGPLDQFWQGLRSVAGDLRLMTDTVGKLLGSVALFLL